MTKRWAFLFPGQGAQYPGMGRDFYDTFPIAKATFQEADELLDFPFSQLIFEGSAAELTLTKNSQMAIFIVSTAIYRTVKEQFPSIIPSVCAGLSLGEYTALVASGKTTFAQCLELVCVRANAMHEACEETQGTMQVVLGLSEEVVREVLDHLTPHQAVWIANLNCPEQVVIAGSCEAMPLVADALKQKGAKRVLPLEVSGAFHSAYMASAQAKLDPKIASTPFTSSDVQIVMNVPGNFVTDIADIRRNLFQQVVSPVRWEKGIRAMMDSVDVFLEMGPGKTLSGMNRKIGVSAPTISIEKIADLEQLVKSVEAYATT